MSRVLKISTYAEDKEFEEGEQKLSPMLSQFAKAVIPPNAVEQARARNAQSVMQQLTSIMANKPRYATVDDAVRDMQERTGLNLHLENIKSAKKKVNKQAHELVDIPESLKKYDFVGNIVNYIKNNIKNTNGVGNSVPQLQHDILSLFSKDGLAPQDILNDEVSKYLSDCILEQQKMLPSDSDNGQLGFGVGKDLVFENEDPWSGLMPSK